MRALGTGCCHGQPTPTRHTLEKAVHLNRTRAWHMGGSGHTHTHTHIYMYTRTHTHTHTHTHNASHAPQLMSCNLLSIHHWPTIWWPPSPPPIPVAGKLPIKALIARQLPTNVHTHTQLGKMDTPKVNRTSFFSGASKAHAHNYGVNVVHYQINTCTSENFCLAPNCTV